MQRIGEATTGDVNGGWRGGALARLRTGVPIAWVQIGMLFAVLGAIPFARRVDNDFWWHLQTGRVIVHDGMPREDPFSWTAGGQPWVLHEWLSEVIIYGVQSALGYGGNLVLFIGTALGSLVISYALGRRYGAGSKLCVGLLILAAVTLSTFIVPRPQLFTWFMFAATLYALCRHYDGDRDVRLWPLPLAFALWANLHLGFFFGLMLLGCWLAALAFDVAVRQRTFASLRAPAFITGACVAAVCLNPSGPEILWYPLRYVFDSQVTHEVVAEWQRPNPALYLHWSIFVTAGLLLLALCSRNRPRPFLFLVSLAVIVLSMQAVRNAPLAAIVLLPVFGASAAARWPALHRSNDSGVQVPLGPALALIAATAIVVGPLSLMKGGRSVSLGTPSEGGYPSAGAEFVRDNFADTRMLNDYNAGGYLVEKLYPEVPVFIDGRTDFYGNDLLADYFAIDRAEPGWQVLLDEYGVEVILISKQRKLARALESDPGWELAFTGPTEVVYARRGER